MDSGVDPGSAHLPALAIHPEPRLAIVETADHHVDIGEQPQAEIGDDIPPERVNDDLRVDLGRSLGGDFGLGAPRVGRSKQDRPR